MGRNPCVIVFSILCMLFCSLSVYAGTLDVAPSDDAQVVEGYPTTNYGGATSMYVASASGGSYLDERSWLKFDLDGQVPQGAVINSAKLRLYCWNANDSSDMVTAAHGSSDDTWSEDTLTWGSQPTFDATALSQNTLTAGQANLWVEWDVTDFVRTGFSGGDAQASLVVKAATEGQSTWRSFVFDSKEFGASLAPRLRIDYTGEWPTDGAFTIFHMNDTHSRLLPHDFDVPEINDVVQLEQVGGAAYFAAEMLALKGSDPESLILDAGDISEGNPLGDLRGNGGTIDFYNLLNTKLKSLGGRGIDAVVVGNHDVRSAQMLGNLKTLANFPAISMNIIETATGLPYFPEYVTVTVNGTKVGILGYTNDESSYLGDDLMGVITVQKCVWDDTDASTINVKDKVTYLRNTENCDVVVLLSHMGQSRGTSGPDAIIADTGGVLPPEVVIAGHWHTWTERVWQPSNMNGKTLVAEAASYMQYIGELEVSGSGKYIQAQKHVIRDAEITPDTDVTTLIDTLITEYNATSPVHGLFDVVGYSAVDLTLDKDKWWTVSEYPWNAANAAGAWITDAMVWKSGQLGLPVDLAFQSGGGIRKDIASGEITYVDIYEAYPWSDDTMIRVQMTGQEIWNWIQADHVGTSISEDWHVTAQDGLISAITFEGQPITLSGTYNVAISEYMFAHPEVPLSDTTPEDLGYSIREGIVDFTAQYTSPAQPMYPEGISPRYSLNTEFAGGFKAVVTMTADSESQPYFEEVFIRFVEAMPQTLARRDDYGLSDLVKTDGSIRMDNRFSEILLYRSHLGFPDGLLQPGDIIEVWGEGSSFDGTPEFIDQEGIYGPDEEFIFHGHDDALARPEYQADIASFWNDAHENHYVKFYAEKTGTTKVRDSSGQEITVYQPGAFYTQALPGNVGDILELTGVATQEGGTRRFRCHTAVTAASVPVVGYPATSKVNTITPVGQSGTGITLTATASDAAGSSASIATLAPSADSQVVEGYPTSNYGTRTYLYVQSANSGSYLNERSWMQFDLAGQVPSGVVITSAKLKLYCWKAGTSNMDASVLAVPDTWTETGLTWSNQPILGAIQDTVTLASGQTSTWYNWDVTSLVTAEIAGDQVVSLTLKADSEGSSTALTYGFESHEYSGGTLGPVLEIQWEATENPVSEPTSLDFHYRYAADGLAWGSWTSIGTDNDPADGWTQSFTYPNGPGSYEFYTVSVDSDGNVEDAPVRTDANCLFNNLPADPVEPDSSIADGATDVSVDPTLSVTVHDPDGETLDVYFYDESGSLIGSQTGVASGQSASMAWNGLSHGTTYGWSVVIDDGLGTTSSPLWFFTTGSAEAVPAMSPFVMILTALGLIVAGTVSIRQQGDVIHRESTFSR